MQRLVKLGDVEFTVVESESPQDLATITDNSVESGQDVADHVKKEASIIEISGQMLGDDAASKLQQLRKYQADGEVLNYIGRSMYGNMVIQSIDREHGVRTKNGFSFDITLKQIRIAKAATVEVKVVEPVTKKKTKKVATKAKAKTNNGKQQPQKKSVRTPTVTTRPTNQRGGLAMPSDGGGTVGTGGSTGGGGNTTIVGGGGSSGGSSGGGTRGASETMKKIVDGYKNPAQFRKGGGRDNQAHVVH